MSDNSPLPTDFVEVNGVVFTRDDLFKVVDDFYTRIQNDELLSAPFKSVHDWPDHIKRLTHFWWIKFGGQPYLFSHYNPVQKHFFAGFNDELLSRWLRIFHETLQTHLREDQVQLWKVVSQRMGHGLSVKNQMFKQHYEETQKKTE